MQEVFTQTLRVASVTRGQCDARVWSGRGGEENAMRGPFGE